MSKTEWYLGHLATAAVALGGLWVWRKLGNTDTTYIVFYLAGIYHCLWNKERWPR